MFGQQKSPIKSGFLPGTSFSYPFDGGGLGIRTLGALRHTTFRESHLRPLGQLSKLYLHPIRFGKWGELMGRTQRFFRFRTLENLHKSRLFRVERSTKRFRFRVSPVMTTSISLRVYFRPLFSSFPKHSKILWREKQERKLKNIRFEFLETRN